MKKLPGSRLFSTVNVISFADFDDQKNSNYGNFHLDFRLNLHHYSRDIKI